MASIELLQWCTRKKRKRTQTQTQTQQPQRQCKAFLVGDKVEVRKQDKSWHPGTIIRVHGLTTSVRYDHLLTSDGTEKLAESLSPAIGLLRPVPVSLFVELCYGLFVDVYLSNAWWEGVVLDYENGSQRRLVFFPKSGDEESISVEQIRLTQDWDEVGECWTSRGKWLFLELVEEKKKELLVDVCAKRVWISVKGREDFGEKIVGWRCGVISAWDGLISEVIRGLYPTVENDHDVTDFEDGMSLRENVGEGTDQVETVQPICDPAQIGGDADLKSRVQDLLDDSLSRDDQKCSDPHVKYLATRRHANWLPALGTEILPGAEYCPEVLEIYLQTGFRSRKSKKNNENGTFSKVMKHLSCMGWKIEFKIDELEAKSTPVFRYIAPDGKTLYSLVEACKYSFVLTRLVMNHMSQACDQSFISKEGATNNGYNPFGTFPLFDISKEEGGPVGDASSPCVQDMDLDLPETESPHENHVCLDFPEKKLALENHASLDLLERIPLPEKHTCLDLPEREAPLKNNACLDLPERISPPEKNTCLDFSERELPPQNHAHLDQESPSEKHGNDVEDIQAEYCPQSIIDWNEIGSDKSKVKLFNQKGNTRSMTLKAKKHLLAIGWNLWYITKMKTRRELRYTSPKGKTYISLVNACKACIDQGLLYGDTKVICRASGGKTFRDQVNCEVSSQTICGEAEKIQNSSKSVISQGAESNGTCQTRALHSRIRTGQILPQIIQASELKCILGESRERLKKTLPSKNNDSICSVCHYGGNIVLCNQCPSSFHLNCIGLTDLPEGYWSCPSCRCGVCGESEFNGDIEQFTKNAVIYCDQCEREYHVGCIRQRRLVNLKSFSKGSWFCSEKCEQIFQGLHELLDKPIAVGDDNLTWTMLKSLKDDYLDAANGAFIVERHCKLNKALGVMHECFEPIKESYTKNNIVEDVLFSKWSKLKRLNFWGFYTVLLERDDELISVATVRIYGNKVAEMPLVGTRFQYRHKGMCQTMMDVLEKKLAELGVERLILPSVPKLVHVWITTFGFLKMTNKERLKFLEYIFLSFPGAILCHKILRKEPLSLDSVGERHQLGEEIRSDPLIE